MLAAEKASRGSSLVRVRRFIKSERVPLYGSHEDAFQFCASRLDHTAYDFFQRQQLHRIKPQWNNNDSTRFLLLISRCEKEVCKVLRSLFRLPSPEGIVRLKRVVRRDPSVLGKSPIMNAIIKSTRVRQFKKNPRPPKKWTHSSSISEYLEKFILEK